jgi:Flp pilus assembly pilin Flp
MTVWSQPRPPARDAAGLAGAAVSDMRARRPSRAGGHGGFLWRSRGGVRAKCPSDDGGTSVEYVLIAVFIALVAALAIAGLGGNVLGLYEKGVEEIPWDGP